MIIPYSTEVLIKKWPIGNLVIMGCCILSFFMLLSGMFSQGVLETMILTGWNPIGLIGHQFIHAGFWHLAFNMLYLWVFGNTVCEKVGSWVYAVIFLVTGVIAGGIHNLMDGNPAVGASGAINGVMGFYLVLHPANRVNCFYWFLRPGTFSISGFWLILLWFLVDAWNALAGAETGIAYWAHVGGFLSGFGLGVIALKQGVATMAQYDNPTLLDYMSRRKGGGDASLRTRSSATESLPDRSRIHRYAEASILPSPAPKDINLDCPHCAQNLEVPAALIGQAFVCPACGGGIQLQEE